jgi:general secretion pathway protein H
MKYCRGFTLLELLVVLALAGLLLSIVPPVVMNMLPGVELRGASQEMVSALRYSRNQAIVTGKPSRVSIDLDAKTFSVGGREKTSTFPEEVRLEVVVAESEVEESESKVASIRFFPDGSSTGGLVRLVGGERSFDIGVDWLTGQVRSSENSL